MRVVTSLEYTRIRQIGAGQGRNSEVYLAVDPQLGGEVVVKEVLKASLSDPDTYWREAQLMHHSAHRNVVPIYAGCQTRDRICLVMPYYSNGSLSDRIALEPLPLVETVHVFLKVLAGLSEIHRLNVLHLDIKPSNILFDGNEPLLSDFGQSRLMRDDGTAERPPMYTLCIPPEVDAGADPTVETDIYQCGVTLYRAVNGDAFSQEPCSVFNYSRFMPHVPTALRRVIHRAVADDPRVRFRSATAFAHALAEVRLPINWRCDFVSNDEIVWTASPSNRAPVRVCQRREGTSYAVEVHKGEMRRCRVNEFWRNGLRPPQAAKHMEKVFRRLSKEVQ